MTSLASMSDFISDGEEINVALHNEKGSFPFSFCGTVVWKNNCALKLHNVSVLDASNSVVERLKYVTIPWHVVFLITHKEW